MAESKAGRRPPRWIVRGTEPIANALSGRRWFPLWAIVHHRGRKTGASFATPVAMIPTVTSDIFLIGLPWGARTNWAQNVVAAGGATVRWKGADHEAIAPRVIDAQEAAALAKAGFRPVVARFPAAIVLMRG